MRDQDEEFMRTMLHKIIWPVPSEGLRGRILQTASIPSAAVYRLPQMGKVYYVGAVAFSLFLLAGFMTGSLMEVPSGSSGSLYAYAGSSVLRQYLDI